MLILVVQRELKRKRDRPEEVGVSALSVHSLNDALAHIVGLSGAMGRISERLRPRGLSDSLDSFTHIRFFVILPVRGIHRMSISYFSKQILSRTAIG